MAIIRRMAFLSQQRVDIGDNVTRMFSPGGISKIEITNLSTGEKTSYDAIITEHRVDVQREPSYFYNGHALEDHVRHDSREITLTFREVRPVHKSADAKLQEVLNSDEEML